VTKFVRETRPPGKHSSGYFGMTRSSTRVSSRAQLPGQVVSFAPESSSRFPLSGYSAGVNTSTVKRVFTCRCPVRGVLPHRCQVRISQLDLGRCRNGDNRRATRGALVVNPVERRLAERSQCRGRICRKRCHPPHRPTNRDRDQPHERGHINCLRFGRRS
jgi:hypothetical protein